MTAQLIHSMIAATQSQIAALSQLLQMLDSELQRVQVVEVEIDPDACPKCNVKTDDTGHQGLRICPQCNWRNKEL